MIRFLTTRGHSYTLKKVRKSPDAPPISLKHYDSLMRARWLRRATYIFTDIDRLSDWDLELASHIFLQLKNRGLNAWNNPALVKTRYPLLRALHAAGLNDFTAWRADEINSNIRYPVFVRKTYGHRAPISDLLHDRDQLQKTLDDAIALGTPVENLLIIEFAAEPIKPGLYRKLAAFRIGNTIVPHASVHDTQWLVKYGKLGIAGEELYQDELQLLQTNPFAEHLLRAFDIAHIHYGRADFGIYRGRVQIYEINTNPHVAPPEPHPSPTRVQSLKFGWEKYIQALRALDTSSGGLIRLKNGSLQKYRPWKNLLVHTRKAP